MNKHFEDTQYYLRRAVETAAEGVKEEIEPIEERFREMTGREAEPEQSRLDKIRDELETLEAKAEGEAREAIESARKRLREYRS